MTSTLNSVFLRIAKLFQASNRGHPLQQHGDLAQQFALVAPMGGGAVIALQQALRLPESDHQLRRGRPTWGWAASPQF
ncbi:MAG TPA: hypothetical protein VFR19_05095 [Hyphomicrobiaceae bacterium]|jgi:hypothetical protein|nr:hypothetical protein [Hyphomicrobiaceae bacterium]